MQDLYEIPRTMFSASNNVNQVLVRVLDGSITQGSPQLLVATDARRDKWLAGEPRIVRGEPRRFSLISIRITG